MSATGKSTSSASTATFISALVTGIVVLSIYGVLFFFLHTRNRKVYQPRTYLAVESKRPHVLPGGFFAWWRAVIQQQDRSIINMNGPDTYFFVRFMKVALALLIPMWLLTWIILMPVTAVTPNYGKTGLSMFTFGNVGQSVLVRHIAHLLVAIVLILFTLAVIYHEYSDFVVIRQTYLTSPAHVVLPRARTVMLNNVPSGLQNDAALREAVAVATKGPIEQIWLPRNVKSMEKIYDARNEECVRLEAAEGKALGLATKRQRKPETAVQDNADTETGDLVSRYIPEKKRPSHKLGLLGWIGKKVDTLTYSPELINTHNKDLQQQRAKLLELPIFNSAFIRFARMEDAHIFAQNVRVSTGSKLVKVSMEVMPEDIIWPNLQMGARQRQIRTTVSWALTIGLIIIWALPVAFVGVVSNIQTVCTDLSFLAWICTLPKPVVGIIQGVLPPVLLAVLFMLLPIVLRMMVRYEGEPRHSDVERKLFSRFWLFQVIHGFLIITVASGLTSAFSDFDTFLKTVPTSLASRLPDASIFFLTFVIISMLSTAGSTNSRVVPYILNSDRLRFFFAGKAPRKAFKHDWKMASITLSTAWPPIALLLVISIVYSVIQPVILGFAAVGFTLLYLTYKYFIIYVCDQPETLETGGLYYPKVLSTIFVALYLEEICLAGLFFLSTNANDKHPASELAAGAIMVVMIVLTALFQTWIEHMKFKPTSYIFLDAAEALKAPSPGSHEHLVGEKPATTQDPGPHYGNTSGLHDTAFDPPASWKDQPTVWIADDVLGIGRAEVTRLQTEYGVHASTQYARMDENGAVWVERGPPDEAWYGDKTN